MSRAMMKRVGKLEQTMATTAEVWSGKAHTLISEKWEDREAKEAALRASPEWQDGDRITHWIIVDPPQRSAT